MRGQILSDRRCPVCGSSFQDNHRDGLVCPRHPDQRASRYIVRFGRAVRKRFTDYRRAQRYLDGLRYEVDQNKFDPREHQASRPISIGILSARWLEDKEGEIGLKQMRSYEQWLHEACDYWGRDRSVKAVSYSDIKQFLKSRRHQRTGEPLTIVTQSKIRSCLHAFYAWCLKERIITLAEFPEFPTVRGVNKRRAVTDLETQAMILDEIRDLYGDTDTWLVLRMLCTYVGVRPGQLLNLTYQDLDFSRDPAGFWLRRKGSREEYRDDDFTPVLPEDLEALRAKPRGLPHVRVFDLTRDQLYKRYQKAVRSLKARKLLPQDYSVSMYAFSRHTSISGSGLTPEELRFASGHRTGEAFKHYCSWSDERKLEVYRRTRPKGVRHQCDTGSAPPRSKKPQ